MSSIIKSRYVKQGTVVELQERMWIACVGDNSNSAVPEIENFEMMDEGSVEYSQIDEEVFKAKEDILIQAKEEADQIIQEATEKAKLLSNNAIIEAEKIMEDARLYTEKKITNADKHAEEIVEQAYSTKKEILRNIEPEIAEVIETLVGHILHEEVVRSNKWIGYVIKKMLMKEKILGGVTICLSPYVLEHMTEEEKMELDNIKSQINLQIDEELNNTTCRIETTEGSILYDISEGIKKIMGELHTLKQLKVEGCCNELTGI